MIDSHALSYQCCSERIFSGPQSCAFLYPPLTYAIPYIRKCKIKKQTRSGCFYLTQHTRHIFAVIINEYALLMRLLNINSKRIRSLLRRAYAEGIARERNALLRTLNVNISEKSCTLVRNCAQIPYKWTALARNIILRTAIAASLAPCWPRKKKLLFCVL